MDAHGDTTAWAQEQVSLFAARRDAYAVFADALEAVLTHMVRDLAPLAIVQVRVKSVASFAEKALRKRHKRPDPVNEFTDLCGARVIVETDDQVAAISRFLESHFAIDWTNSEDTGKRLGPATFGYRSVHYIVSFRDGVFPTPSVPVEVPEPVWSMPNPRAEVQVRTILQHAWATTVHDSVYKAGFEVPEAWHREFARVAAMLETSDEAMSHAVAGLRMYASRRAAYLPPEQLEAELDVLRIVASHAPDDQPLALRLAAVAEALGDWDTVLAALAPHLPARSPLVLRAAGVARCARGEPGDADAGRQLLEEAAAAGDPRAIADLAADIEPDDPERARSLYRRAFDAAPEEPDILERHLVAEVVARRDPGIATTAGPAIAAGIATCEARAAVGVDLPDAYLIAGELRLLQGRPYDALHAYAKAVQLASAPHQLAVGVASLDRLRVVAAALPGFEWCHRMLLLGWASRFPNPEANGRLAALATPGAPQLARPVAIVAGGCDPAAEEAVQAYRDVLVGAFAGYEGTIVGGGTAQGVSGLVGDVVDAVPTAHAVSWLPARIDRRGDATPDPRYEDIRRVDDADFSPLEPLQAWTDLVASGVRPGDVVLVGINGGRIAAAEYRIALALGSWVALIRDSGREAARMAPDDQWGLSDRLLSVPAEVASLRPLLKRWHPALPERLREPLARRIHEEYLRAKQAEHLGDDAALTTWESLPDSLKDSNRAQAEDILAKLASLGLDVAVTAVPVPLELTPEEVEQLAVEEHGRWVAERLLTGWRLGDVKDIAGKRSPYLVAWADLPDDAREWDRASVRSIPAVLACVGLEVRRRAA